MQPFLLRTISFDATVALRPRASTAQSTCEAAWHHRGRLQRSADRDLLRAFKGKADKRTLGAVAAAATRLDKHHGSSSGLLINMGKDAWYTQPSESKSESPSSRRKTLAPLASDLRKKQPHAQQMCSKDGCTWHTEAWRVNQWHEKGKPLQCKVCLATLPKYKIFADDGKPVGGPKPVPARNAKGNSGEANLLQQVRKELAEVKKKLADANAPRSKDEEHMAVDSEAKDGLPESDKIAELRRQVKDLKGDLETSENMDEARRNRMYSRMGGYDEYVASVKAQLENLYAQLKGCKTVKQQLDSAQGKEARLIKAEKGAVDDLAAARQALEAAGKEVEEQEANLEGIQRDLAAAKAEVGVLAAKRATETAAHSLSGDAATQADPPLGYISVDQAHALWQAREQEIQQLFMATVAHQVEAATASSAPPSEAQASDVADLDSVELVEDDEKWQKAPKAKRRAIITRERDLLAGKIKQVLKKVSTTDSPFNKKKD